MGKCQTDPMQKVYEIVRCYAGAPACCPALCCPTCLCRSERILIMLDFVPLSFEIGGFKNQKKTDSIARWLDIKAPCLMSMGPKKY